MNAPDRAAVLAESAGRKLDALVAQFALGREVRRIHTTFSPTDPPAPFGLGDTEPLPRYSTDSAAALELLPPMFADGWNVYMDGGADGWLVTLTKTDMEADETVSTGNVDFTATLAEAVAKCVLLAKLGL